MRRRALLRSAAGLAAAVGLAGCFMDKPPAELRLIPATPDLVDDRFARAAEDYPHEQGELVADLLREGSATKTDSADPTLPDDEYVRDDGRYYRVTTTFVDDVTLEGYDLIVRRPPEETDGDEPDPVETLSFDDLPPTDRSAFRAADPGALEAGIGRSVFLSADEFDPGASRFASADGPVEVAYEGTTYLVEYDGREVLEDRRYRYDIDAVADSRSGFAAHLEERYAFALDRSSLSAEARDILDEAVVEGEDDESGYSEDDDLSAAFRDLLELISDHDAPGRTYGDGGEWLCVDGGTTYVAEISYAPSAVTEGTDYRTRTDTPTREPTDSPTTGDPTTGDPTTVAPAPGTNATTADR